MAFTPAAHGASLPARFHVPGCLVLGSSHPLTNEGCGMRRAPYDNIFTMAGMSLRRLAAALPSEVAIYHAEAEQE